MIDVKSAVAAAFTSVRDLYDPEDIRDLILEEVELFEGPQRWVVTLSHARNLTGMEGFGGHHHRCYKVFTIDAQEGSVCSMKHRDP